MTQNCVHKDNEIVNKYHNGIKCYELEKVGKYCVPTCPGFFSTWSCTGDMASCT